MKIKSARDFWAGLLFLVVGIVFAVAASSDRLGPSCAPADACASSLAARFAQVSAQPGPGFVALGLALALALLGTIVLFKSLTIESDGGAPIGRFAWRPLLAIEAAIVAFAMLIENGGLVAASVALVVIGQFACGGWRWRHVAASAAVFTVGGWLLFVVVLKFKVALWPAFLV